MAVPTRLVVWDCATHQQAGYVEMTADGDIVCSGPALHEMVGRWMYVGGWTTPEQLMQNLDGRRNGYTVYLPEGAPPPWEQPVPPDPTSTEPT